MQAQNAAAPGAQPKYRELAVPEAFQEGKKAYNDLRLQKQKVLMNSESLEANQRQFDQWYTLLFYSMTRLDQMGELARKREELFRDLKMARAPEVYQHVTAATLKFMTNVAKYDFHPAVRYNAMLIIGELNAREANPFQKQPAVPLPAAREVMLAEFQDPKQIDAVRIAALVGLLRHVEAAGPRLSPQDRNKIIQPMLTLIKAKQPPEGRTAEGHAWMQRRALDILAGFRNAGPNGEIVAAIEALMDDEQAPLSLRCTAAYALGQIELAAVANLNAAETARRVASVATTACQQELARIEQHKKTEEEKAAREGSGQTPGMGGMSGYSQMSPRAGMFPGGPGSALLDPQAQQDQAQVKRTLRRLKYQLQCVQLGLTKVAAASQGRPDQPQVTALVQAFQGLLDVTDQSDLDLDSLPREIRKNLRELEPLTQKAVPVDEELDGPLDLPGGELPAAELPADAPADDEPADMPEGEQ